MGYKNTTRDIVILLGSAVIAAFMVNYFSPTGISLVGQWDESISVTPLFTISLRKVPLISGYFFSAY